MKIPFSPPYIDDDVKREVMDTLESGWITTGPKVRLLEQEIISFCNAEAALGVNSATSAMMLVLHWWGVKKGDEVIIAAYTYCATALAVMHVGATPIMVDVCEDFNINVQKIEDVITLKTKAIITVDFGGWPCDYDSINALINAEKIKEKFVAENENQQQLNRILLMADAAHSLGAVYKNKPSGVLADITVFSFHAVKNITTAEGGMICLNMPQPFDNAEICATLRLWSLNGQTKDALAKTLTGGWKYDIVYAGFKINLPDVLAAIALAQIKKYKNNLLVERKRVFDFYDETFSKYDWAICPPFHKKECESSYHIYPLRIKGIAETQRDKIIELIISKNVSVNVHFVPLPMLSLFKEKGYLIGDYPQSYHQFANEISLPIYPQLNNENCKLIADAVIQSVNSFLNEK
ncbi:MAG: DegT/DnrJ/EryC1/StrS family aminotransferase [Chitinophagaceae bacterium]